MPDEDLVGALCDIEDGLNEWEVEFVDSIAKQFKAKGYLTPGQRKKAEQIFDEKG